MKPFVYLRLKSFWVQFGWFSGEELTLISVDIFKTFIDGKYISVTIFDLQVLKFSIGFGFS